MKFLPCLHFFVGTRWMEAKTEKFVLKATFVSRCESACVNLQCFDESWSESRAILPSFGCDEVKNKRDRKMQEMRKAFLAFFLPSLELVN